jgi:hypothetical protein
LTDNELSIVYRYFFYNSLNFPTVTHSRYTWRKTTLSEDKFKRLQTNRSGSILILRLELLV